MRSLTPEKIFAAGHGQTMACARGLKALGYRVFSGPDQAMTVSFQGRADCEEIAEFLGSRGIAVRAGLHCAPLAHESAAPWIGAPSGSASATTHPRPRPGRCWKLWGSGKCGRARNAQKIYISRETCRVPGKFCVWDGNDALGQKEAGESAGNGRKERDCWKEFYAEYLLPTGGESAIIDRIIDKYTIA